MPFRAPQPAALTSSPEPVPMLVLPAIDLKDGHCVRLVQGQAHRATLYSTDPVAVARQFRQAGARMLHLVDLDGAFQGHSANGAVIQAIRAAVDMPIELGGGMRSLENIAAALELGVDSVIVGTLAVREPTLVERALERFSGARVQLGIDARGGKVAVQGWVEETALDAVEFGRNWQSRGVTRAVFTDIARDGMLQGPNLAAIRAFAHGSGLKVTASGGVSSLADVERIKTLEPLGVDRVIVGKALYEGAVKLEDLI